jgi:hypothetical protein
MTNRGEASNLEHLGDVRDLHKARAIAAYAKTGTPSLTNQLLFAILAQLDKISNQLKELAPPSR